MVVEILIEIVSCFLAIILFYFFIPKIKYREAILGFLIMQVITWPLGFIVVELNLIEYPVRIFKNATKTSFTFEYLVFPIVGSIFNIHYPNNSSFFKKLIYSGSIVSVITLVEVLIEKFTDNIEYINWEWYISWITMCLSLHLSYLGYKWFNNLK